MGTTHQPLRITTISRRQEVQVGDRVPYLDGRWTGKVVEVNAHWSDQPNGMSGWYVVVEVARRDEAEVRSALRWA